MLTEVLDTRFDFNFLHFAHVSHPFLIYMNLIYINSHGAGARVYSACSDEPVYLYMCMVHILNKSLLSDLII